MKCHATIRILWVVCLFLISLTYSLNTELTELLSRSLQPRGLEHRLLPRAGEKRKKPDSPPTLPTRSSARIRGSPPPPRVESPPPPTRTRPRQGSGQNQTPSQSLQVLPPFGGYPFNANDRRPQLPPYGQSLAGREGSAPSIEAARRLIREQAGLRAAHPQQNQNAQRCAEPWSISCRLTLDRTTVFNPDGTRTHSSHLIPHPLHIARPGMNIQQAATVTRPIASGPSAIQWPADSSTYWQLPARGAPPILQEIRGSNHAAGSQDTQSRQGTLAQQDGSGYDRTWQALAALRNHQEGSAHRQAQQGARLSPIQRDNSVHSLSQQGLPMLGTQRDGSVHGASQHGLSTLRIQQDNSVHGGSQHGPPMLGVQQDGSLHGGSQRGPPMLRAQQDGSLHGRPQQGLHQGGALPLLRGGMQSPIPDIPPHMIPDPTDPSTWRADHRQMQPSLQHPALERAHSPLRIATTRQDIRAIGEARVQPSVTTRMSPPRNTRYGNENQIQTQNSLEFRQQSLLGGGPLHIPDSPPRERVTGGASFGALNSRIGETYKPGNGLRLGDNQLQPQPSRLLGGGPLHFGPQAQDQPIESGRLPRLASQFLRPSHGAINLTPDQIRNPLTQNQPPESGKLARIPSRFQVPSLGAINMTPEQIRNTQAQDQPLRSSRLPRVSSQPQIPSQPLPDLIPDPVWNPLTQDQPRESGGLPRVSSQPQISPKPGVNPILNALRSSFNQDQPAGSVRPPQLSRSEAPVQRPPEFIPFPIRYPLNRDQSVASVRPPRPSLSELPSTGATNMTPDQIRNTLTRSQPLESGSRPPHVASQLPDPALRVPTLSNEYIRNTLAQMGRLDTNFLREPGPYGFGDTPSTLHRQSSGLLSNPSSLLTEPRLQSQPVGGVGGTLRGGQTASTLLRDQSPATHLGDRRITLELAQPAGMNLETFVAQEIRNRQGNSSPNANSNQGGPGNAQEDKTAKPK